MPPMRSSVPLGEILLKRELITPDDLDAALAEQLTSRSRLGDILVARGKVGFYALYKAIAEHYGLLHINLLQTPPQEELLNPADVHDYISLRAMPWKKENGTVTVATSEPGEATLAWARERYGQDVKLAITSPFDIRHIVERRFAAMLEEESRNQLFSLFPAQSARHTFQREQKAFFITLFLSMALLMALWPVYTITGIVAVLHLLYAATMLFKWLVFYTGMKFPARNHPLLQRPLPTDEEVPIYTVLVPLYKEKESLPHLLAALARLDYPASKLDIKIVLEADDTDTINAALALKPAWNVEIVRVPLSIPRTKPKALNYALRFARGEYVTVYDAEDEPEPLQLKNAVRAFHALPLNVGCLQSRLNYYNASENWLTRWFAMEYAILFEALMPGLQRLKVPLPLGGTSNHLAIAQLRRLGEWDPYNVTEDADLGVRLAAQGLRTMMMDSITMEEAPVKLSTWLKQRSRWIKGYMQTWLVHMRDPLDLLTRIGPRSFLGFQFFVGLACLAYLSAPLIWALSILAWAGHAGAAEVIFPVWLQPLVMFNLALHFVAHWIQALRVLPGLEGYSKHQGKYLASALFFPFYFLLHSLASYKSLWQLIFRPHFWEKTTHGLTVKRKRTA